MCARQVIDLFSVYFIIDANTGFAVGELGRIVKTTNYGINWDIQISGMVIAYLQVFHESTSVWLFAQWNTSKLLMEG